ncbi:hypothetical protein DSO57_1024451 [Entomophthora muscae]|uniref:Uncharacterized protein n=1 Tax=Entomophthora muscae TaxID=34485 RepID=A0ACC2S4E4_9FUNG|nr:hypothetical protein DSO57_1024451 [Entomophthora muscae]
MTQVNPAATQPRSPTINAASHPEVRSPLLPVFQILITNINSGVLLLNILLMYLLVKRKTIPLIHQTLYLITSLSQCIFSLSLIVSTLYSSLKRELLEGFVCRLSAMLFHLGLYTSLATTTIMVISKYYAVTRMLRQRPPLHNGIWILLLIVAFIATWTNSFLLALKLDYYRMPSDAYCQMTTHPSTDDTFITIFSLSEFLGSFIIIIMYYIALTIVLKRKLRETIQLCESLGDDIIVSFRDSIVKQTTAINQSFLFAGGFYTFFFVEIISMLYTVITKEERSPLVDGISVILLSSNGLLNPIVLLFFHPTIHVELLNMLGLPLNLPKSPRPITPDMPEYELVEEQIYPRNLRPKSAPPGPSRPSSTRTEIYAMPSYDSNRTSTPFQKSLSHDEAIRFSSLSSF